MESNNRVMSVILPVKGISPQIGEECFIAPNATIVGEVVCGRKCTFWFNSVVRGDVNSIILGDEVNVQDGAVIHGTFKTASTKIGSRVSIGHNALVHGCTIEDRVLIGMGAIVMDKAIIGAGSIIAAGAVVLANTIVPPGSLYAGIPAKFVKKVSEEHINIIERTASNYPLYASWFNENKEE